MLERPRLHPTEGFNESLIGTGFWYLGEAKHAPVDVRGEEAAMIDNRIDVFSKTFLGLTVACARCHDHKFDAITTRDYYALAGVLQSSRRNIGMLDPGGKIAADRRQLARLRAEGDQLVADSVREAIGELQADEVRDWARSSATAITSPENPLYLLAATGVSSPSAFETQLRTAVARVEAEQARSDQARTHLVPFANFRGGLPEGWSSTGEAFGSDCVTSGLEWDWNREPVSRLPAGQAHSGALSGRLRGILRSPTFELRHKQVLYSVRGDGVQLRIIIDGYRMNDFSELLFKGANLNVKTGGETKWLRHAADVSRYVGHRCHLEIVDNGDGWGAIDEIAFSNGGPDPSGPPAAASIALAAGQPATFDELLAATLRMAAQGIDQSADQASVELCNAMLRHGLLQPRQQLPRLAKLRQQMAEIEARLPAPRLVIAMTDGTPENEHVFIRGSHKNLGEPVPRRLLTAFGSPEIPDEAGSGRLLIAQQMFDGRNPFPARVMANRVWHHLFGRGIVDSPDNFGVLGKRPTNPQLLDHLAGSLRDDGWSLKRLIRRIVLSQTYQMASRSPAEAERTDPSNLMLHRASIRRLQAEAIRDSMLAISGRLDERVFGPSIPVYLTPFMQGRGRPKSGPLDGAGRRSIYTRLNRNFLPPMMLAFDMPIPFTTIGRRSVSNVPAQALILLNDPFVAQQARLWSQRLLRETADPKERLQAMYEEAFARPPVDAEVSRAVTFLKSRGGNQWQTHAEAWSDLCHVMMNTKEFIFLN